MGGGGAPVQKYLNDCRKKKLSRVGVLVSRLLASAVHPLKLVCTDFSSVPERVTTLGHHHG